jgi:hypothetical protein
MQGNKNAKKSEHGLTVSFYVDAEHVTKLRAICTQDGREPTDENVRLMARSMARSIIEESIKVLEGK